MASFRLTVCGLDITGWVRSRGDGWDPFDADFAEPQLARSPLREGAVWIGDQVGPREMQVPLMVGGGTPTGLRQALSTLSAALDSGQPRTVEWTPPGATQPTVWVLIRGRFEPEWRLPRAEKGWMQGVLRLWVEPWGRSSTMVVLDSGPLYQGFPLGITAGGQGDVPGLLWMGALATARAVGARHFVGGWAPAGWAPVVAGTRSLEPPRGWQFDLSWVDRPARVFGVLPGEMGWQLVDQQGNRGPVAVASDPWGWSILDLGVWGPPEIGARPSAPLTVRLQVIPPERAGWPVPFFRHTLVPNTWDRSNVRLLVLPEGEWWSLFDARRQLVAELSAGDYTVPENSGRVMSLGVVERNGVPLGVPPIPKWASGDTASVDALRLNARNLTNSGEVPAQVAWNIRFVATAAAQPAPSGLLSTLSPLTATTPLGWRRAGVGVPMPNSDQWCVEALLVPPGTTRWWPAAASLGAGAGGWPAYAAIGVVSTISYSSAYPGASGAEADGLWLVVRGGPTAVGVELVRTVGGGSGWATIVGTQLASWGSPTAPLYMRLSRVRTGHTIGEVVVGNDWATLPAGSVLWETGRPVAAAVGWAATMSGGNDPSLWGPALQAFRAERLDDMQPNLPLPGSSMRGWRQGWWVVDPASSGVWWGATVGQPALELSDMLVGEPRVGPSGAWLVFAHAPAKPVGGGTDPLGEIGAATVGVVSRWRFERP